MTNLEALQASIMYPVEEAKLKKALFDRGLYHLDDYSLSAKLKMDLATADVMVVMVTAPEIQEGGYKINLANKEILKTTASAIYLKCGEVDPFTKIPTITSVSPW